MKCSRLIEELKQYNPDADVTTPYSEDICLSFIDEGGADKNTTEVVFIEFCDSYQDPNCDCR